MSAPHSPLPEVGVEWLVDAHGCAVSALQDRARLEELFARVVEELGLHPVAKAHFHVFPDPFGVTGMLMLSESHLTCHSFPERGFLAVNLYCCRERPEWPWQERLAELVSATRVDVQRVRRPFRPTFEGP